MRTNWEYRTLQNMDVAKGMADASIAGHDGWQLVTIVQPKETVGYALILKRELASAPGDQG